jgi:hypothetical protein
MTRLQRNVDIDTPGFGIKAVTRAARTRFLPRCWRYLVGLLALVVAGTLLADAIVASSIGFQDLVWPVSLSAQFSGLFLLLTGLASLVGVFGVFSLIRGAWSMASRRSAAPSPPRIVISVLKETSTRPLGLVAGAALSGLYINLTIVFYAFHYETTLVAVFGALAVICAGTAYATIPIAWKYISTGLKATGILLAALGTVTQFWYQSVYVPENTPVGMSYTVAIGSVTQAGDEKLVQVNVTMEDAGSIPELALASMIVVSGVSYPGGQSTVLSVLQPITDTSYFFPSDEYSKKFLVIAEPGTEALDVDLFVDVALTTKLALDQPGSVEKLEECPGGTQSEWYVSESKLRRFTRGSQVLWSDWCPNGADSYIDTGVATIRRGQLVAVPGADSYFIRDTSRYDTLLLD